MILKVKVETNADGENTAKRSWKHYLTKLIEYIKVKYKQDNLPTIKNKVIYSMKK